MAELKTRLFTEEEAAAALWEAYGNAQTAAQALGVGERTLYRYMAESTVLKNAAKQGRLRLVGVAQYALYQKILDGDIAAIIFTLKTLGKDLGFSERHEVGIMLSAELTLLMGQLGIDQRTLMREFESLVREEAARLTDGNRE